LAAHVSIGERAVTKTRPFLPLLKAGRQHSVRQVLPQQRAKTHAKWVIRKADVQISGVRDVAENFIEIL
jgi:hypothetical protein